jgi:hypothetical protein
VIHLRRHGHIHTRKLSQPAIGVLVDSPRHLARIASVGLLSLEAPTVGTHATLRIVHGLLQRIVLPAEHVITVLAEASGVACAEDEGLRTVGGPIGFIVELRGVPDNLQLLLALLSACGAMETHLKHDLWDLHWMRGRTVTTH